MKQTISRRLISRALQAAAVAGILLLGSCGQEQRDDKNLRFTITFSLPDQKEALDGRLLLLVSADDSREPRFQIGDGPDTQLVFGIDVENWSPGAKAIIDEAAFGYPLRSLSEIPAGEYRVQALLHRYETFHRADGHTVKMPMDRGEGQQWNRAPGNLLSSPKKIRLDLDRPESIEIILDREIPPLEQPQDGKYVKHISIRSTLLSEFWGRPVHLGAVLLLPEGFDEHPEARYPLVINHGHFPSTFRGFSESPPADDLPERQKARAQSAYDFYKLWTGPDFPRVIIVQVQHANPYYDDSYAVNSANVGPYGDAITRELIPFIESNFRGIGQGWARTLYGGSTGGWIALAVQVFYPDDYNGCWASCPDPVDFHAYQIVNIYDDRNAFHLESRWKQTPKPGARNYLGQVLSTVGEQNRRELALGTRGRSGGQWDIWQAVFGPVGEDGYVKPIWDKLTGEIDHEVAEYWRENYDLCHILGRDWRTLGPKLRGRIHVYVGDMDTFHLNNAVYLLEEFLESTADPYYDGEILYGDRFEHCWSGYPQSRESTERQGYHERFIPLMVEHMLETAPEGADVDSWRY